MKNRVIIVLCMAMLVFGSCQTVAVYADDAPGIEKETDDGDGNGAKADEIVTKFRLYRGKVQYRRWNATRGYWVDPYWINA